MNKTNSQNFSEKILLVSRIFLILSPLSFFFGVLIVNLGLRKYGLEDFSFSFAKSFAVGFVFIFLHLFFFFFLPKDSDENKDLLSTLKFFWDFLARIVIFLAGLSLLLPFSVLPKLDQIKIGNCFYYLVMFLTVALAVEFNKSFKELNRFFKILRPLILLMLIFVIVFSCYEYEKFLGIVFYFGYLSLVLLLIPLNQSFHEWLELLKLNKKSQQEKAPLIVALIICGTFSLVFGYSKILYPNLPSAIGGEAVDKNLSFILRKNEIDNISNQKVLVGQIIHSSSGLYFVRDIHQNIKPINISDIESISTVADYK